MGDSVRRGGGDRTHWPIRGIFNQRSVQGCPLVYFIVLSIFRSQGIIRVYGFFCFFNYRLLRKFEELADFVNLVRLG